MKTCIRFMSATVALALALASQNAMATDATASAAVISPISVAETNALNFGKIMGTAAGGTITLTNNASNARTGTAGLFPATDTTVKEGLFTVTGESGLSYAITVDASVTLTDGGSNTMTATLSASKATGTIVAATDTFGVGGTLTVAANQAAGAYSGTYAVTVAYN